MKDHQLKLIDSTYPVKEAKEVLCSLLNDKINFINLQILSVTERLGSDTDHLKKRVEELKESKATLIAALKEFEQGNYLVEIDCNVDIKVQEVALA